MFPNTRVRITRRLAVGATAILLAVSVQAHGEANHGHKAKAAQGRPLAPPEQKDWGIAGSDRQAKRTVQIRMTDNMRFTPDRVDVKLGETVRFVVRNQGKMMHEFVIGTPAENAAHAQLMLKFPNMEHDEPYMAHVGPGRQGKVVWTFNRPGVFEFACLIAGHYQAGMVGTIHVIR
jgi:uncharacterized cupredoxin-like copper-binding protein